MHSWGLGGHLVCGYHGIWIDMVLWWDLSWEYNGIQRDVTNNIQYDIGVCLNMEEWWKMRPNCNLKVGKMDEHQGEPWYFGSTPFWDKPRKLHEIGGIFLGEWWYEWKISMAFFHGGWMCLIPRGHRVGHAIHNWWLVDDCWIIISLSQSWMMNLFPPETWLGLFASCNDAGVGKPMGMKCVIPKLCKW
jgi:hypothetical protein